MAEPSIFAGLKVIDAASFIAAPAAATILADFGAEVIKVEPTGTGDAYRAISFQPGMPKGDTNFCWTVDGRNKRSLALDLKRPEAQEILHRLVAGADVFITNYPPPARARLGITYGFDISDVKTSTTAAASYFQYINFSGVSGPNSLNGIKTSHIVPSYTYNTVNHPITPTGGRSIFASIDFAGSILIATSRSSLESCAR